MKIQVVAFYTDSYAGDAARLRCSLSEFLVPHRVTRVKLEAAGDPWKAAVLWKPTFILQELLSLGDEFDGLFYTDADSILRREPPWEEFTGLDVGYARFRWTPRHQLETLTGGLYFSRSTVTASFVQAWVGMTPKYRAHDTPEQMSLAEALTAWDARIVHRPVGLDWVHIFDAPARTPAARPIFLHMQASRERRA